MGQLRLSDSDLLKELSAGELLEVQLNPSFELEAKGGWVEGRMGRRRALGVEWVPV